MPLKKRGRFQSIAAVVVLTTLTIGALLIGAPPARAASALTFSLSVSDPYGRGDGTDANLGWDQVGLDSNNADVGPNLYTKGVRVCNPAGNPTVTNVTVTWVWDETPNPTYIHLQTGSANPIVFASLAPNACSDAYFNLEIDRTKCPANSNKACAWDTSRRYHIEATALDDLSASLPTTYTPRCFVDAATCGTGPYDGYRQIYVEKIQSQARNSVNWIKYVNKIPADLNGGPTYACSNGNAGPATVYIGQTYYFCLQSDTAPNGYESMTTYINLKNTIFQLQGVTSIYSSPPTLGPYNRSTTWGDGLTKGDQIFENACQLTPNPYSVRYRSNGNPPTCQTADKVGGTVQMVFTVKILASSGGPTVANGLIYDFSGASWHYNADYGTCKTEGSACDTITITDVDWEWGKAIDLGGGGTDISWRTAYESDNLGFNLYREGPSERVKLNEGLVAGSALSTGPEALMAGRTYHWMVPPGDAPPDSTYWVEAIDLNGEAEWYGPIDASPADPSTAVAPSQARVSSPLISGVGSVSGTDRNTAQTSGPTLRASSVAPGGIPSGPSVKVEIDREGWYSVPLAELGSMGLDVSDPSRLHLFAEGVEQAARVRGGALQFYGTGLDTRWTATRAYWIVRGGSDAERIRRARSSTTSPGRTWFPATSVRRDRSVYFSSLLNGRASNFFGAVVSSEPLDQPIEVVNAAGRGSASLRLSLQGVTNGNHDVAVSANGIPVGRISWSGQDVGRATFDVPRVRDGANTVTLSSGTSGDYSLVSEIALTYPRTLSVDHGALRFTARGGTKIAVGGSSTRGISVYDITDPSHPMLPRTKVRPDGQGGYAAIVAVPGEGRRILYAFEPKQQGVPLDVARTVRKPALLRRGADMVVISAPQLADSLDPLVAMHEDEGMSVSVVDVDQIYDSYGWGEKSPNAIRSFLSDALGRATPPRYVLLVGDASLDPRGFMGPSGAAADMVPTMMVDTSLMETSSDSWYARRGDGDMAFALGRLPVGTPQEAEAMVRKIVEYASAPDSGSFVVATDEADGEADFPAEGLVAGGLVPDGIQVVAVDRGSSADPRADLLAALAQGPAVLDYLGHGSVDLWRGGFLTGSDAQVMANTAHPTFLVAMTCLNGYFIDTGLDSLSESLLKARGGAIGAWASSGMTDAVPQARLNRAFLSALYSPGATYVGDAILEAQASVTSPDVLATWTLLGDPAVRVH